MKVILKQKEQSPKEGRRGVQKQETKAKINIKHGPNTSKVGKIKTIRVTIYERYKDRGIVRLLKWVN